MVESAKTGMTEGGNEYVVGDGHIKTTIEDDERRRRRMMGGSPRHPEPLSPVAIQRIQTCKMR